MINVSTSCRFACDRSSVIQPSTVKTTPNRQPIRVDFADRESRNEQPINNRPIVNQLTNVVSEGAESGCSWRDNGWSEGLVWRKTDSGGEGTSGEESTKWREMAETEEETVARMAVKKRSSKGDDTRGEVYKRDGEEMG